MAKILYPQVITEDLDDLKELEKYHRYSHLFQRVRMLGLLKSEECSNLAEAARALGYSWRQCQRWFASYQKGAIEELLKSRVHERGRQQLATPEAMEDLKQTMKLGKIATIGQADEFLTRASRHRVRPPRWRRSTPQTTQDQAKDRSPPPRGSGPRRAGGFQKNFAGEIRKVKERHCQEGKPLKVLAFDEARFELINWHRRRYCPMGLRPPWIVKRS